MSVEPILKTFELKIPNTPATATWLQESNMETRSQQIAAAFSPEAGVEASAIAKQTSAKHGLIEAYTSFIYKDYERACAEFLVIGGQLGFPPGTRLTHVVLDRTTVTFERTYIKTW